MRRGKKRKVLLPTIRGAISFPKIVYDLLDRFIIPDAAPLADPLPASHVGSWNIILDSGSNLDVASGTLEFNGAVASADPRIFSSSSFARVAGRAFFWRAKMVTGSDSDIFAGLLDGTGGKPDGTGFNIRDNENFRLLINGSSISGSYEITFDTEYDFALICRATGAFYFVRGGTEYPILVDRQNKA